MSKEEHKNKDHEFDPDENDNCYKCGMDQFSNTKEGVRENIYKIVDAFLTEAKNQHGEERSLDRLNADRHLAVEAFVDLLESHKREVIEAIKSMKLVSSDEGYKRGIDSAVSIIENNL